MLIFYGRRLFGKVDVVRGQFHVATMFTHGWFIPMIPLQSYVIRKGMDVGVPIPRCWRSIRLAWLRMMLVLGMLFVPIFGQLMLEGWPRVAHGWFVGSPWVLLDRKVWPAPPRDLLTPFNVSKKTVT